MTDLLLTRVLGSWRADGFSAQRGGETTGQFYPPVHAGTQQEEAPIGTERVRGRKVNPERLGKKIWKQNRLCGQLSFMEAPVSRIVGKQLYGSMMPVSFQLFSCEIFGLFRE